MTETRVKISTIVQSQLPDYVKSDYPLAAEFLQQYYKGVEYQGAPVDLIDNIDEYSETTPQVAISIGEYQYRSVTTPDKEINFMALIASILNTINN